MYKKQMILTRKCHNHIPQTKIASEYDQETPQSLTADEFVVL